MMGGPAGSATTSSQAVNLFGAQVKQLKQQSEVMHAMLLQQQQLLLDCGSPGQAGLPMQQQHRQHGAHTRVPGDAEAHGLSPSKGPLRNNNAAVSSRPGAPPPPVAQRPAAPTAAADKLGPVNSPPHGPAEVPPSSSAPTVSATAAAMPAAAPAPGPPAGAGAAAGAKGAASSMQPGLQADNYWPMPAPRDAAAAQADWWLDSSPMEELRAALRCRPLPPCSLHDTGACTCQHSGAGGGQPAPSAWDALDLYGSAASSCGCGGSRSPGGALVAAEVVGGAALGEARLRASYTRALRQLHSRWQHSRQQLEQRHQQELQQQAAAHASALQQLLASQQALLGQLGAGGELGGRLAALAAQQEALADQVQQLAAQVGATTLGSQAAALQVEQLEQRQEAAVQEMQAALQLLRGAVTHTSEQLERCPGRQEVVALVEGATAAALDQVAGRYATALADREAQHAALLQDLASLRAAACDSSSAGEAQQQLEPEGHEGGLRPLRCGSPVGPTQWRLPQEGPGVAGTRPSGTSNLPGASSSSSAAASFAAWQQAILQRPGSREAGRVRWAVAPHRAPGPGRQGGGAHPPQPPPQPPPPSEQPQPQPQQQQQQQQQQPQQQQQQQQQQGKPPELQLLDELLGLGPPSPEGCQQQAGSPAWGQAAPNPATTWAGTAAAAGPWPPHNARGSPPRTRPSSTATAAAAAVGGGLGRLTPAQQASANSWVAATAPSRGQPLHAPPTAPPVATSVAAAVLQDPMRLPAAALAPRPPPPAVQMPTAAAAAAVCGSCLRCGLNDVSSPGECSFHPALLAQPGPLLYSPQWHACKAAGHTADMPGCYARAAHYYVYPLEAAAGKEPSSPTKGKAAGGWLCSSPSKPACDRLGTAAAAANRSSRGVSPGRVPSAAGKTVVVQPRWKGPKSPSGKQQQAPQPRSRLPQPLSRAGAGYGVAGV